MASMKLDREPIRNRVDVIPHPTVVRLSDLESEYPNWLSESFIVTAEIDNHLRALAQIFKRPAGSGVFLIGHYGSGKSHFLTYFIQQIRTGEWLDNSPSVSFASLVNFSSENRLEELVTEVLGIELTSGDRRKSWDNWFNSQTPDGVVLVLDELSEFLKSKSNVRHFTEDIRFLQFMGEWAQDRRFWVIAAMQEAIEHTGELEYSLYRKIKDRYPFRLMLSPAHVKALIADGILKKKENYQLATQHLIADLRRAFPNAGFDDTLFSNIYPLHPATIELLEEIRDRFSQSRGVVDFTVSRLRGDPARGIEAFLDQPWGRLLTPDLIIDHFYDLFELQPEFVPLAQQVMPWYKNNVPTLFQTEALQTLAHRILKCLILVHLSPSRESLSVAEAAEWLLFSTILTDPEKNLSVVEKVLVKLAEQGRYIIRRANRYQLELKDDGRVQLDKFLTLEIDALREQQQFIPEILVPLLPGGDFNPFSLPRNQWQNRQFMWHFHEREYAVWFGDQSPTNLKDTVFCIRLPWGDSQPVSGILTIEPGQLTLTEDMIELAALVRLNEKPIAAEHKKSISQRIQGKLPSFSSAIRHCWSESILITDEGHRENAPRFPATHTLTQWLDAIAVLILRRRYPAFERFAPAHGRLPKEAWLRYMRFALNDDLGRGDADDYVKLIREAYLVPMGLLKRAGRDYVVAKNLENLELVKALMPLLEHSPSPKTVHRHFADPIYGLVADQVNMLLVFLMLQGEIDLIKERKSYRDYFETLVNPLQYDRVELGFALGVDQLKAMQRLCEAFSVRTPKQWTVLAQKRVVDRLYEIGQKQLGRLQTLRITLQSEKHDCNISDRLERHIDQWRNLAGETRDLHSFEQFYTQVNSISDFIHEVRDFENLAQQLPQLLEKLRRLQHLFGLLSQQSISTSPINQSIENLGETPDFDHPEDLQNWLHGAQLIYDRYKLEYQKRHDQWWQTQSTRSAWQWKPPPIAFSQHLGLSQSLENLETCRRQCDRHYCRGLVNLEFQPQCGCGFDGASSPFTSTLEQFINIKDDIVTRLQEFFDQDSVKQRIKNWPQNSKDNVSGYLTGQVSIPDIQDIVEFEQFLSGVDSTETMDVSVISKLAGDRAWNPESLLQSLAELFTRYKGRRIKLVHASSNNDTDDALLEWCLQQCLRFGQRLPDSLPRAKQKQLSEKIRLEWVSSAAIQRIDQLGLDQKSQDIILKGLIDGQLALPDEKPDVTSLLFSVQQLLFAQNPVTPQGLAAVSLALYRFHDRFCHLARTRWLDRLEDLANASLTNVLPTLADTLKQYRSAQWLLLDCWGLPLLEPVQNLIELSFNGWRPTQIEFAEMSRNTNTDACYRQLLDAEIKHSFEKCNVIDRMIHNRTIEFNNMKKLIVAELEIELSKIAERLDPDRDLIIFSDHGFRLCRNGQGYQHGEGSTLERVVPVFRLARR